MQNTNSKKKLIYILYYLLLKSTFLHAQIYTQSANNGFITITPNGVLGKTNSSNNGYNNVALGDSALWSNTSGFDNTAIGYATLPANTLGFGNTANGTLSLHSNTSGNFNTASGLWALSSNTTGNSNVAFGVSCLSNNTIGNLNTSVGVEALYSNQTGTGNNACGAVSLFSNTTGNNNTALGIYAGSSNLTGNNNTYLGMSADIDYTLNDRNFNNTTAIGANAKINASNKVRIGDANVTVIEGQVAWSNPSDRRLKENIIYTNRLGLDFIMNLKTVSYNYLADKNKTRYDGFIAQDVEQLMRELNLPFSGLKKSDDGIYSLAYSDFVMPLVNSIQELKAEIEALKQQITKLSTQNTK